MTGTGSHRIALVCGSLVSGPVYLAAYAAGSFVEDVGQPTVIGSAQILPFLVGLIPAMLAGFFVMLVPLGFAILVLSGLARACPMLRAPLVWALVGGGAAALIAWGAASGEFSRFFATVCTGAVSLRLARAYLAWPRPERPVPMRVTYRGLGGIVHETA
jgi:hypothetical protein